MLRLALWGHHYDEYQAMFDLEATLPHGAILEYGCGPSALNAELSQRGISITSFDPWFTLSTTALQTEILASFEQRLAQVDFEQEKFDLSRYGTLAQLVAYRRAGMTTFLADYPVGKEAGRYQALIMPASLPLADFSYDLALSAHYFFTEQGQLDEHLMLIRELARVAKEVRIFPLIDRRGIPSPLLGPVLLGLQQANYGVEVRNVNYHLQPQGHAMLRVWAQECVI